MASVPGRRVVREVVSALPSEDVVLMTRDEKIAEAGRMRDEGLSCSAIARELGVYYGTAYRWLNPDTAREYSRRSNARPETKAAKRAWAVAHDRDRCPCGAVRGVGSHRRENDGGLCRECERDVRTVGRAMREERIAEMWEQGLRLREIAAALGSTVPSIGASMSKMRDRGWDLPRRNNWSEAGLAAVADGARRRIERQRAC